MPAAKFPRSSRIWAQCEALNYHRVRLFVYFGWNAVNVERWAHCLYAIIAASATKASNNNVVEHETFSVSMVQASNDGIGPMGTGCNCGLRERWRKRVH